MATLCLHTTSGATASVKCWMMPATAPCRLLPSARRIRHSANDGGSARWPASSTIRSNSVRVDLEQRRVDEHHRRVEQVDHRRHADREVARRPRRSSAARSTAPDRASSITSSTVDRAAELATAHDTPAPNRSPPFRGSRCCRSRTSGRPRPPR